MASTFAAWSFAKLDESEIEDVKQLTAEQCVPFFRDQHMTLDEPIATGRRVGGLHNHASARSRAAEAPNAHPEVMIGGTPTAGRYPGKGGTRTSRVTSSVQRSRWCEFASMYAAYESLSPPMKGFLLGLTAMPARPHARPCYGYFDPKADYPENGPPMVRTHPLSTRGALHFNLVHRPFDQLTERETDDFLGSLFDHLAHSVGFQARFHWEPNSSTILEPTRLTPCRVGLFCAKLHGYGVNTVGERPFQ